MYQVLLDPKARKFLVKQSIKIQLKIAQKVDQVAADPFTKHNNLDKLREYPESYRLRIGDIRVLYRVYPSESKMVVWDIDFRGGIYKH